MKMMLIPRPPVLLLLVALILAGAPVLRLVILASLRRRRLQRCRELESAFLRFDRALSGSGDDASTR